MSVRSIDQMPFLKQRLGKAGADRIRYAGRANPRRQPAATNIPNGLLQAMQYYRPTDHHCEISDILSGVANLDQDPRLPLSVNRLYAILQCVPMINTREIMVMLDVDKRQAQRYVRALKLAFPYLESVIEKNK